VIIWIIYLHYSALGISDKGKFITFVLVTLALSVVYYIGAKLVWRSQGVDVDLAYAHKVQAGRLTYTEAVREGMYRPLGHGDVDIAAIVDHLQGNGYDGWYTLEQDTILTEPPAGEGPVADVRTSVDYLRSLLVR